jgi:hypothetical protein
MGEEASDMAENDPDVRVGTAHTRTAIQMKCLRCGAKDQVAEMPDPNRTLKLPVCPKCRAWNWEIKGDVKGLFVEDDQLLNRLFRKADPNIVVKSRVWHILCTVLDDHMVRSADGGMSNIFCTKCEGDAHPDGRCECACHAAWDYRVFIENAVRKATDVSEAA